MSTNANIYFKTTPNQKDYTGLYVHWDGDLSGSELITIAKKNFNSSLKELLTTMVKTPIWSCVDEKPEKLEKLIQNGGHISHNPLIGNYHNNDSRPLSAKDKKSAIQQSEYVYIVDENFEKIEQYCYGEKGESIVEVYRI